MPRTIKEIPMNEHTEEEVYRFVDQVMQANGFMPKLLPEGKIWGKGDGTWIKQQNFAIHFLGDKFVMEAWLKDDLTGESDLTGFVAKLPKKKMQELLDNIEREIRCKKGTAKPAIAESCAKPIAGGSCSYCGEEYQPGQRFCGRCGRSISEKNEKPVTNAYCVSCGALLEPGMRFCIKCGSRIE